MVSGNETFFGAWVYTADYEVPGNAGASFDYYRMHDGKLQYEERVVMEAAADSRSSLQEAEAALRHEYSTGVQMLMYNEGGDAWLNGPKNASALRELLAERATEGADASTYLNRLPYFGDRSKCRMSAAMANAYAEALESMPATAVTDEWSGSTGALYAALIDPADDGMPLMIAGYAGWGDSLSSYSLWSWDGTRAVRNAYDKDLELGDPMMDFYLSGGRCILDITDGWAQQAGDSRGSLQYEVSNGNISLLHKSYTYGMYMSSNWPGMAINYSGRKPPLVDAELESVEVYNGYYEDMYRVPISELVAAGWTQYDSWLELYMLDGKVVSLDEINAFRERNSSQERRAIAYPFWTDEAEGVVIIDTARWRRGADTAAALRGYAENLSPYTHYEKVTEDEDAYVRAVAEAAAAALGGEVSAVYKIADGVYYVEITFDETLVSALDGCGVQLFLGDETHYVQLSYERLQSLVREYGALALQFSMSGEGVYIIHFLDGDGNELEQVETPVTIGLPAPSLTSTIMASYGGRSDNWGGQYDPATGTISFDARYSGQYEVLDNDVKIDDIADLPEDVQQAIRIMVSKGYMDADGGLFNPDGLLTRYQFTQALTGMFFALDHDLKTTFPDVPEDSPYYAYVASAQAKNIVNGIEGLFAGEDNMTTEQMLAVAARTLIEQKGYAEPANAAEYLSSFADGDAVSEWALAQVAMSVRDGIKDRGGALDPQGDITRAQAADILYRLFLLLYDVPPVALELPPETALAVAEDERAGLSTAAIAAIGGGAVALGGGGAAWYVLAKKKRAKV